MEIFILRKIKPTDAVKTAMAWQSRTKEIMIHHSSLNLTKYCYLQYIFPFNHKKKKEILYATHRADGGCVVYN